MRRVVATGTFDILHPGHLFYLAASGELGDELHVIVARDVNVRHKPRPVLPEGQRLAMVSALRCVDFARLGDEVDMFRPIREISPHIITIGFNQHFDEGRLRAELADRGLHPDIVRIGPYEGDYISSSRAIIREVLTRTTPGRLGD